MLHAFADALRAQRLQQLVEALAAEIEGLRVGAVAEAEHAVAHARQVGPLRLQVFVEALGVVRHVALAVGRGDDQEHALALEHRGVELVHEQRLDLEFTVVPHQLEFLRHELRGAGHGADQEIEFHGERIPLTYNILHHRISVKQYIT